MINKFEKMIKKIAVENNDTEENVLKEMQKAVDLAWATKDEQAKKKQRDLFGDKKPTIQEFLMTIYNAME